MRKSVMPSWWQLLVALALIAFISVSLYPASVAANVSGVFDNATASIADLDDDLDEMLRRLRPQGAANAAAAGFEASAPRPVRLPPVFAGPGPVGWAGRPPADRGPPAAYMRPVCPTLIATLPSLVPASRLQPHAEQHPPASSSPAVSPAAPRFRQVLPAVNTPSGFDIRPSASINRPTLSRIHRPSS